MRERLKMVFLSYVSACVGGREGQREDFYSQVFFASFFSPPKKIFETEGPSVGYRERLSECEKRKEGKTERLFWRNQERDLSKKDKGKKHRLINNKRGKERANIYIKGKREGDKERRENRKKESVKKYIESE